MSKKIGAGTHNNAEAFLEQELEKMRSSVMTLVKDKAEQARTMNAMRRLDEKIKPVIMELYHGGTPMTGEEAGRVASTKLRGMGFKDSELAKAVSYFKARWETFKYGLTHFGPRLSDTAKVLGVMQPASIEDTKLNIAKEDLPHVKFIRNLANHSYHVHQAAMALSQDYKFDNIKGEEYERKNQGGGVVMLPGFATPVHLPNQMIHPLFVALGAIDIKKMKERYIHSDIARVVDHRLRGGMHGTLRTREDAELFWDMSRLPINQFCSRNQLEDLARRAHIHSHLKAEINNVRSANFAHGSWPLMQALKQCQQTPLQGFVPDNAVDMFYKISNALAFYPTVVRRLPGFANPAAPIPMGTQERVPFLRVALPHKGDDRFDDVQLDNGAGIKTGFPLNPKRWGEKNKSQVFLPNGLVFSNHMQIAGSESLVFVADRRMPHHEIVMKDHFKPTFRAQAYVDGSYKVNTRQVASSELVQADVGGDRYEIQAVVCLKTKKVDGEEIMNGYETYLVDESNTALKTARGGATATAANLMAAMKKYDPAANLAGGVPGNKIFQDGAGSAKEAIEERGIIYIFKKIE